MSTVGYPYGVRTSTTIPIGISTATVLPFKQKQTPKVVS